MAPQLLQWRRREVEEPEILSSKDDVEEAVVADLVLRRGRAARRTVTSIFTSYSFVNVKSTRSLSMAQQFVCLPAGFVVC